MGKRTTLGKIRSDTDILVRSFGVPDFRASDADKTVDGHAAVYDSVADIRSWFPKPGEPHPSVHR